MTMIKQDQALQNGRQSDCVEQLGSCANHEREAQASSGSHNQTRLQIIKKKQEACRKSWRQNNLWIMPSEQHLLIRGLRETLLPTTRQLHEDLEMYEHSTEEKAWLDCCRKTATKTRGKTSKGTQLGKKRLPLPWLKNVINASLVKDSQP